MNKIMLPIGALMLICIGSVTVAAGQGGQASAQPTNTVTRIVEVKNIDVEALQPVLDAFRGPAGGNGGSPQTGIWGSSRSAERRRSLPLWRRWCGSSISRLRQRKTSR